MNRAGCLLGVGMALVLSVLQVHAVDVKIGSRDNRPIDIIITGSSGAFNSDSTEASIRQALADAGVDLTRVRFDSGSSVSISSEGSGAQEIVDTWVAFPDGKKGQQVINDGNMMIGPQGGGPGGMYEPVINAGGDVDIDFTFQTTCVPYSPAVLLKWTRDNQGYHGYIVGMSTETHIHAQHSMPMNMYIWRIDGGSEFAPMWVGPHNNTADKFAKNGIVAMRTTDYMADGLMAQNAPTPPFNPPFNGCYNRPYLYYAPKYHYHVTMKGNKIRFELYVERIDGQSLQVASRSETYVLEWEDTSPIETGSVGFFSHNANAVGMPGAKFQIEDINDLIDAVRAPSWRPYSHRFVIDIIDKPREDLDNTISVGELAERLSADQAHYIGVGTSETQSQQAALIKRMTTEGDWKEISEASRDAKIAAFIEPIVNKLSPEKDTLYMQQEHPYAFNRIN